MANTVRLDREKFEQILTDAEGEAPGIADELRGAVIEGPAPGDVLEADDPEPTHATRVIDREGDVWTRDEEGLWGLGWATGSWEQIVQDYGPVTVLG